MFIYGNFKNSVTVCNILDVKLQYDNIINVTIPELRQQKVYLKSGDFVYWAMFINIQYLIKIDIRNSNNTIPWLKVYNYTFYLPRNPA